MAAIDDINAKLENLNAQQDLTVAALSNIRQDIADLKASIPTSGGLSEAQTQDVLAKLTALETKVSNTAADAQALDAENPSA